uniref:Peptidase S54 rhomboid domain-containing protein n=1 Tax=Davidia involucrata TaxID=16924 RepID=A0A5B7A732_DAVIN
MQKLLSLKLLSKSARNLSNNSSSFQSICSKNLFSLSNTNPNHLHTYPCLGQPRQFFSHFTTSSHSWKSQNGFPEKIYGFLSNPILVKKLLPNTLLKGPSKGLIDSRVGFLRAQFQRRSFDFNTSFESHRRGWQSWFQRLTADGVTLGLILANVAVFMLWRIADRKFMRNNFTISLENFRSGRVHTMITSAFSHIEAGHLISNMIGLYFFGMSIGKVFGPEYLLKLYLSGAVVGSVFYLVHHAFMAPSSKGQRMWGLDPSRTRGLGASGAVNAIMLLDIFLFPKSTLYLEFIIPVPAILLGIFLIGKDMVRILEGDSQISGSAHLGGAVVAAIAWARIRRGRF